MLQICAPKCSDLRESFVNPCKPGTKMSMKATKFRSEDPKLNFRFKILNLSTSTRIQEELLRTRIVGFKHEKSTVDAEKVLRNHQDESIHCWPTMKERCRHKELQ